MKVIADWKTFCRGSSVRPDPRHFIATVIAEKAPNGTNVSEWCQEASLQDAWILCCRDHRLGLNESKHGLKNDLNSRGTRMIDNPLLIHTTGDRSPCSQSKFIAVKAKDDVRLATVAFSGPSTVSMRNVTDVCASVVENLCVDQVPSESWRRTKTVGGKEETKRINLQSSPYILVHASSTSWAAHWDPRFLCGLDTTRVPKPK